MSLSNRYPSLDGRPVLITGAGAGIGRAMALAFAGQGARLGLIDRDAAGLERTASMIDGTAVTRVADVTDIEALRGAIAAIRSELGPIRILINNAGSDTRHDFRTITPDYWDDRMATNLRHLAFAAQAVTPEMEGAGGGVIINLGSTSWMQGAAGLIAYGTAKAAIGGFTQCLARDLGGAGIRVMCIAPGRTVVERTATDPAYVAETIGRQAVKHLVKAEDIASLALFLCSDDARILSGQTIIADGGHMMR
ncbi:MAG: SDR family oxidoreductase [Hyphomicrobiales bacterium]|nr:MAG: SDR family oxidoreductase [Hyphomicrobiales bacterium]